MKQRVMLYFGSFNPVHKGHIALAEYAIDRDLCDRVVLIVSPQSPYKEASALAPEMDRFEMAEIACHGSRYPMHIVPSAIEFLLPKPSYTIETLRYLEQNNGHEMQFSILMGSDQISRLDGWKEYDEILKYPIYVYPRRGAEVEKFAGRITLLDDAPLQDISATDIRTLIERGGSAAQAIDAGVAEYIRKKGLWNPTEHMDRLTDRIEAGENDATLYIERGKMHYGLNNWGAALNDFNRALQLDDANAEARQYVKMVQEILEFRHKDIYNP